MVTQFDRGAAQLAQLNLDTMTSSAQIEQKTSVRVPGGAFTTSWAAIPGAVYPCRLSPLTVEEQLIAMQTEVRATYRLALPAGTDVNPDHRVAVTGLLNGVAFTKTLAVVGQLPRSIEAIRFLLCAEFVEGS